MKGILQQFKWFIAIFVLVSVFSLPDVAQTEQVDPLYDDLSTADSDEAAPIAARIRLEWEKSGSAAIDFLFRKGHDSLEAGNVHLAVEHFTAVVDHAPEFAQGYVARAAALFSTDQTGPAIDDLRQALVLNPRHFDAMLLFATILETLERPKDAYEVYNAVLAIYPANTHAQQARDRLFEEVRGAPL